MCLYLLTSRKMNSKNLKKTYVQTYEKFFFENQTVISVPFVLSRSGDILNNYSGVSIKQKIPLRIYMWYTRTKTGSIRIKNVYHLDINEYQFIESNALEYAPYIADINSELEKRYGKLVHGNDGIEINILTELPRGVWLWFWSILALLLSVIIHNIADDINEKEIKSMRTQNINEILMDTQYIWSKIFEDAFRFDKVIYGMVGSWTKMASFFDSPYPIISFSEDCDKTMVQDKDIVGKYYGFRLNELFKGLRDNPYLPIDYGVIYSGKPVLLEQIAWNNYKSNQNTTKALKDDLRKLFNTHFSNLHHNRIPRFYKYLIAPETDEFDATYGKLMGILSLKMLYFMSKIFSEAYEESHMLQFLDGMKKFRQGDYVTRNSSTSFLRFIKSFLENFHGPQQYIALSPCDSTIMGGSLVFAMPLEWFRKILVDAADKTNNEFIGSKVIYSNRVDGVEHEWLKIEQDLKQWIFSEFMDSGSYILKMSDGQIQIGNHESMIKKCQVGILLDMINNKMYINGRKLTSEDLHSQTATVDILNLLIKNISKEVHNKEFGISSYSKNKNDMLGKIVLPLIELIERETGKKMPLICKWSIYDFYMKLNPSDIQIAVVEKLQR